MNRVWVATVVEHGQGGVEGCTDVPSCSVKPVNVFIIIYLSQCILPNKKTLQVRPTILKHLTVCDKIVCLNWGNKVNFTKLKN